ncbi:pseudouridine synthase family protein [Desulfitobacterium dichloroeliminans LMG P-21439]|uniref:Pseudouridine synthase n=1 Tax=Desulfitobacterium dichloroeliminans (strain LMG P-21439 / DCA1) TaxID=871963 RepID=L0F7H0_DESDL|nr:pseudouridine synthase [Desulfitobacterium dichloroeliminans]AGA69789.1 pseudouridine synthase family protein [Desulfitobacterium dichloroeliminans LMG P-21439]
MKDNQNESGERLQKVLAQAGLASRRHAEEIIEQGRVQVNGEVIRTLGTKVRPGDQIIVDGSLLKMPEKKYDYYLLHKPTGYITSVTDPQGRKTVMDLMKGVPQRVYPVGRLDYDTSGLLVLTNDGELAHRLMHPSYGVEKTYRVEVHEWIPTQVRQRLEKGVELEDGKTAPAKVQEVIQKSQGSRPCYEITIHEGRNRQVRRMFKAIGYPLTSLKRIRFGSLRLEEKMAPGKFRPLTTLEVQKLRQEVELK